jgi:predicted transcriptional regulator
MKRKTTVYMEEQTYRQLKQIARAQRRSQAELIRAAVADTPLVMHFGGIRAALAHSGAAALILGREQTNCLAISERIEGHSFDTNGSSGA